MATWSAAAVPVKILSAVAPPAAFIFANRGVQDLVAVGAGFPVLRAVQR